MDGPSTGAPDAERLYEPAAGERQLTPRAVVVGVLLGGIVCAMNISVGLKIGWYFGGSIIAAILGFSAFRALRPTVPYTLLENNITQTAGSSAGLMGVAAGFISAIPALELLGHEFEDVELGLWALAVAFLGVFYAVPLRRQMVVEEKLRFPTGTAAAQTLVAIFSRGDEATAKARALVVAAALAGGFALSTHFVPEAEMPPVNGLLGGVGAWLALYTFQILLSPSLFGAGLIIGPRVGFSLLAGAVVGWGILAPWVTEAGLVSGPPASTGSGARGWILWPGVAIMVADSLTTFALQWRTVLRGLATVSSAARGSGTDGESQDAGDEVPTRWWVGGLVVATLLTASLGATVFGIAPHHAVVAVGLSSVLAIIATRTVGESDINPVGPVGKVTQLAFAGLAPGRVVTNLMTAAITAAGATQAADMMQDLKTGHLLGASPRQLFKAQLAGILGGIVVAVPVYRLFSAAYEIGGDQFPAPAAQSWKAMAELLSVGPEAFPDGAGTAVVIGALFGMALPVLRRVDGIGDYVPSGVAFGIAFLVHAFFSIPLVLGTLAWMLWRRIDQDRASRLVFAVASGLIAGDGLMSVLKAGLTLLGVGPLTGG